MSLGQFTFKKNDLIQVGKLLTKRDMRKKVIKSSFPTMQNNKIYKAEDGTVLEDIRFAKYSPIDTSIQSFKNNTALDIPQILETNYTKPSVKQNSFSIAVPYSQSSVMNSLTLKELLEKNNIPCEVTSYGRNSYTKSGHVSYHSKENEYGPMAIDIVPKKGYTFDQLKATLLSNPEIINYFDSHGVGILDEVTPNELNKYGGTGPHLHIGYDSAAVNQWKSERKILTGKLGTVLEYSKNLLKKYAVGGEVKFAEYTPMDTQTIDVPDFSLDIPKVLPTIKIDLKDDPENPFSLAVPYPTTESAPINLNGIKNFYNTLYPIIYKELKARGLPTDNAIDMIAQLGLESGWKGNTQGTFNLGNIKGYGDGLLSYKARTNKIKPTSNTYVNYANLEDFVDNYIDLLQTSRYDNPFVGDFGTKLKSGGYATDPNYVNKIKEVKATMLNNI